jgi:glycosyltransferase involved in cell wall biosynthesis
MKSKYLILADGKSPHTLKWVKELVKFYDLSLVSLNGISEGLFQYIQKENIYIVNESVDVSGGNSKLLLKYFDIKKIVEKLEPKFINAHYLSSYGVIAAFIKRSNPNLKLIQSTWGSDILVTPYENSIKRKIAAFGLAQADLITSDSYFMSDKIIELSANENIETFAFGLDQIDMNGENEKDENLLFSNRALSENYNIDTIIKWFAGLKNDKLRLVIANDGNLKNELQNLAKRLGVLEQISFVGFLSKKEQDDLYKKAAYYISVPSSDSTAVSLLEAMSFGCYPIVSNLPANREWIIDECNGSFFSEDLALPKRDENIQNINKNIINKKAIFSKSIKNYVKRLENL